jgi:hypothetical protein
MTDYITAKERVYPPRLRRWLSNFMSEVWWKYCLKCARWELEKFEQARKQDVAGQWRAVVVRLSDQLKALGVDPDKEPEDLTRSFEVWLIAAFLIVSLFGATMFSLYRQTLIEMIQARM